MSPNSPPTERRGHPRVVTGTALVSGQAHAALPKPWTRDALARAIAR